MPAPFRSVPVAVVLLAVSASSQGVTQLTLATVLARGPALATPLPKVVWLPGGHQATVVRTKPDGSQTLHRVADGKVADDVLVDARALLQAVGAPATGSARF